MLEKKRNSERWRKCKSADQEEEKMQPLPAVKGVKQREEDKSKKEQAKEKFRETKKIGNERWPIKVLHNLKSRNSFGKK